MLHAPRKSGFTLIELLIVISIMGILAGLAITSSNPSLHEQLQLAAQTLAADIDYARNLAVSNGSKYRFTFDSNLDQYVLKHSGTNTALNTLPMTPLRSRSDPADQQIVTLADLPHVGAPVQIYSVLAMNSPVQAVSDLEFGPLGETTRTAQTVIWLGAGAGSATRYLSVRVNPITGICTIENFQATAPATAGGSGS